MSAPPSPPFAFALLPRRCWPAVPRTRGPAARSGVPTPTGRLVTLGLAVPNLFLLPFGTALGIYAFWVLLHNEARHFFEAPLSQPHA